LLEIALFVRLLADRTFEVCEGTVLVTQG